MNRSILHSFSRLVTILWLTLLAPVAHSQDVAAMIREEGLLNFIQRVGPPRNIPGQSDSLKTALEKRIAPLRDQSVNNVMVTYHNPLSFLRLAVVQADIGDETQLMSILYTRTEDGPKNVAFSWKPLPVALQAIMDEKAPLLDTAPPREKLLELVISALQRSVDEKDFTAFAKFSASQAATFGRPPPWSTEVAALMTDARRLNASDVFRQVPIHGSVKFLSRRKLTDAISSYNFGCQSPLGAVVFNVFFYSRDDADLVVSLGYLAGDGVLPYMDELKRVDTAPQKK
jgi:hypothetical protein